MYISYYTITENMKTCKINIVSQKTKSKSTGFVVLGRANFTKFYSVVIGWDKEAIQSVPVMTA